MASRIEENNSNYPPGAVGQILSNGTTEVVVLAAPGPGKRYRLTTLHVASANDAIQTTTFRNGISGATFYSILTPIGSVAPQNVVVNFGQGGRLLDVNQSLNAAVAEASQTDVRISAAADILTVLP